MKNEPPRARGGKSTKTTEVPEQLPILQAVAKSPRPSIQFSSPLSHCDYEAMMGVQRTVDPIAAALSTRAAGEVPQNWE